MMKLTYPAIFYEGDGGYAVEVHDLPSCVRTEGGKLSPRLFFMGTDAASGWILDELEDGKPVPKASPFEVARPEAGGFVSVLILDMDAYAAKVTKRYGRTLLFPPGSILSPKRNTLIFLKFCRIR
jgi:predicted RNase H-like HicB family nuclease